MRFRGESGEDVRRYTSEGQFGIWNETGTSINLALITGAFWRFGYDESVGTMIDEEGIRFPSNNKLREQIRLAASSEATREQLEDAAADLLAVKKYFQLESDFLSIRHPWRKYSLAWQTKRAGIPFTCHPMFGHDIIYTHPINLGAAIGRTAERDFLSYADSISRLEGGVYLSVGSAVMSPMIFEKTLSMSRNLARQRNDRAFFHSRRRSRSIVLGLETRWRTSDG